MRLITHLSFGLFLAILFDLFLNLNILSRVLFYASFALGSLLPDLDYQKGAFKWVVGHRGIFHSIWLLIIVFIASYAIFPFIAMPLTLGVLSHLAMDALTPQGVRFLFPLKWKIRGSVKTGSLAENVFLGLLWVGVLILFYSS